MQTEIGAGGMGEVYRVDTPGGGCYRQMFSACER